MPLRELYLVLDSEEGNLVTAGLQSSWRHQAQVQEVACPQNSISFPIRTTIS